MESVRKSAPWIVAAVLAVAASVFLVRTLVESGGGGGDDIAKPNVVSSTGTPTPAPSASVSASASPSASASASPSPSPTPKKTKKPEPEPTIAATRSTDSVEWLIKGRLDGQGAATVVSCPSVVSTRVGTTYTCAVSYASVPSKVVADAFVRVTTTGGAVSWSSRPR